MLTRQTIRCIHPIKHLINSNIPAIFFSTSPQPSKPSRPEPPPIRVGLTDSAGRGVFATRRIAAGELIHTGKPVVAHPLPCVINRVCYYCLRRRSVNAVEDIGGKCVSFCSPECHKEAKMFYDAERRADWLKYDDYCRTRRLKYPLLAKRLACMIISGAASADILDILQPATLSPETILKMDEGFTLLRDTLTKANIEEAKTAFLTKQWYIGVLARIRINAFRVDLVGGLSEDLLSAASNPVEAGAAVGYAVYLIPSFYNHDCDPNAYILWIENADARLIALRDVEPGEEVRICYIDSSVDRDARQTLLSEGFGFECHCRRCTSGD